MAATTSARLLPGRFGERLGEHRGELGQEPSAAPFQPRERFDLVTKRLLIVTRRATHPWEHRQQASGDAVGMQDRATWQS